MQRVPISVLVLSFNSRDDIPRCLASVSEWAEQIIVVDSFSTDGTAELAKASGAQVYLHEFESFAKQRNWALATLPLTHQWLLHLDADERLTPTLREEITRLVLEDDKVFDGYYIRRRFVWMGRWLKHGGQYPSAELRLFRWHLVRVVDAGHREYVALRGKVGTLENDIVHESLKGLSWWIEKHNKYSSWEAEELATGRGLANLRSVAPEETLEGGKRVRLRKALWNRIPLLMRPFIRFACRYAFQLGFLDGMPGFLYCFLHDLWYPLLIDAKFLETKGDRTRQTNR